MSTHTLWIDTDPGFDDLITLLMAARAPQIELMGIGVVAGNAPLADTLDNTLRIAQHYQLTAPIYAGCTRPLVQRLDTAENILGKGALGSLGQSLPPTTRQPQPGHAVLKLIEAAKARPGQITLVAIGPLTNVALAFHLEPQLPQLLRQLILMGGSSDRGNHTAAAEFNIWADPEAAAVVFDSGLHPVMFGLNLTRQVMITAQTVETVRRHDPLLADHMAHYLQIRARQGQMPLHDPTTVAWLLYPELFEVQPARVEVELSGRHSRGMTVVEFRIPQRGEANAQVATLTQGEQVIERILGILYTQ